MNVSSRRAASSNRLPLDSVFTVEYSKRHFNQKIICKRTCFGKNGAIREHIGEEMAEDSLRKTSAKSKSRLSFSFALLSYTFDDSLKIFCFLFTKVFINVK